MAKARPAVESLPSPRGRGIHAGRCAPDGKPFGIIGHQGQGRQGFRPADIMRRGRNTEHIRTVADGGDHLTVGCRDFRAQRFAEPASKSAGVAPFEIAARLIQIEKIGRHAQLVDQDRIVVLDLVQAMGGPRPDGSASWRGLPEAIWRAGHPVRRAAASFRLRRASTTACRFFSLPATASLSSGRANPTSPAMARSVRKPR